MGILYRLEENDSRSVLQLDQQNEDMIMIAEVFIQCISFFMYWYFPTTAFSIQIFFARVNENMIRNVSYKKLCFCCLDTKFTSYLYTQ